MEPDPSAAPEEATFHPPPAGPLKRLAAAIALAALLASAALSSWWILSGRADFTRTRPAVTNEAGPAETPDDP